MTPRTTRPATRTRQRRQAVARRELGLPPIREANRDAYLTAYARGREQGHVLRRIARGVGISESRLAHVVAEARAAGDPRAFVPRASRLTPAEENERLAACTHDEYPPLPGATCAVCGADLERMGTR